MYIGLVMGRGRGTEKSNLWVRVRVPIPRHADDATMRRCIVMVFDGVTVTVTFMLSFFLFLLRGVLFSCFCFYAISTSLS